VVEGAAGQPNEFTQLLIGWRRGDNRALDQLMPLVYDELRRLAAIYLSRERQGHTLQATALVHEAWIRLAAGAQIEWQDRAHFLGIAARLMRQIMIQYARAYTAAKRGSGDVKLELNEESALSLDSSSQVIAVDDALGELSKNDERKSRIVEMKYFGGLMSDEIAEALGISVATVGRELRMAHAFLRSAMNGE
jgi:RNA polymerase sigma factor (TIGR02999 family)